VCREKKNIDYCRIYRGEKKNPFEETRSFNEKIWNAEKKACEEDECARDSSEFVFFVSMQLRHGLKKDIARYIAEYNDCSISWKKKIAEIMEIGDSLLFEKPKGRTVFEKRYAGPICNEGYLLFYNGRIYSYYGTTFERESECYVLEQENKGLVLELKDYSKTVLGNEKTKPKDSVIPTGSCYYKFFSKRFYGDNLDADNQKIIQHIERIFHWYAMPLETMKTDSVEKFASCWKAFMEGMVGREKNERVIALICHESFPEDCWALGFKMDCFESFDKKYGSMFDLSKDKTLEQIFQIVDDYKILGNAIFSQWRYYNHWAHDPILEFDPKWFIMAFDRLVELYKNPRVEELKYRLMDEIQKYVRFGYPDEFGFEFAATVDFIKVKLKESDLRPDNVEGLLEFIKDEIGYYARENEPRLAPAVVSVLVKHGSIDLEADGKIIYHEKKLGLNR